MNMDEWDSGGKAQGSKAVACVGTKMALTRMVLDVFAIEYTGTIMEGTDSYSKKEGV